MNALIFAAGLGTRLKPWTLEHPKALVEVGGEAMLGRVLRRVAKSGLAERVVVNVHHYAEQVRAYLEEHDFGVEVAVSDESSRLLDTGGGMAKAIELLGGPGAPLLVHNADILTDFPLEGLLSEHLETEADVSLLVARRESSRQLLMDGKGRMRGWLNRKTGETLPAGTDVAGLTEMAFGGVHLLGEKAQMALLERYKAAGGGAEEAFGIMPFYISQCDKLNIRGYEPAGPYMWHDIGTPEKLAAAAADIKARQC